MLQERAARQREIEALNRAELGERSGQARRWEASSATSRYLDATAPSYARNLGSDLSMDGSPHLPSGSMDGPTHLAEEISFRDRV